MRPEKAGETTDKGRSEAGRIEEPGEQKLWKVGGGHASSSKSVIPGTDQLWVMLSHKPWPLDGCLLCHESVSPLWRVSGNCDQIHQMGV